MNSPFPIRTFARTEPPWPRLLVRTTRILSGIVRPRCSRPATRRRRAVRDTTTALVRALAKVVCSVAPPDCGGRRTSWPAESNVKQPVSVVTPAVEYEPVSATSKRALRVTAADAEAAGSAAVRVIAKAAASCGRIGGGLP